MRKVVGRHVWSPAIRRGADVSSEHPPRGIPGENARLWARTPRSKKGGQLHPTLGRPIQRVGSLLPPQPPPPGAKDDGKNGVFILRPLLQKLQPTIRRECPYLVQIGTFWLCSVYEHRPQQCRDHEYLMRFCPIGLEEIFPNGVNANWNVAQRIDEGWMLGKTLLSRNK